MPYVDPKERHAVGSPHRSHHPRAESRQLSVGSGVVPSIPKGNRTVVNLTDLPAIQLILVA